MDKYRITFDTRPGHGMGWIDEYDDQDTAEAALDKWRGRRRPDLERITLAVDEEGLGLIDLDGLEPDDDGIFN